MHDIGNAFEIKRSATWNNYIHVCIHTYQLLYQSIVTADNQKSTIDTQKEKTDTNTTLNIIIKITKGENKRGREEK